MGIFDAIKNLANQVTGGAAKVTFSVDATDAKSAIKMHITDVIKYSDLAIDRVYARIKSGDHIRIPCRNLLGGIDKKSLDLDIYHDVLQMQEFMVSPAQTLKAGQAYTWTHDLTLPSHAYASYLGKYANHEWACHAASGTKGNDPDSGLLTFI